MAKYYVRCGEVKKVIQRQSRERAAFDVVEGEARSRDGRFHDLVDLQHLGLITSVSEIGFRDRQAQRYPTHRILCRVAEFGRFDRDKEAGE